MTGLLKLLAFVAWQAFVHFEVWSHCGLIYSPATSLEAAHSCLALFSQMILTPGLFISAFFPPLSPFYMPAVCQSNLIHSQKCHNSVKEIKKEPKGISVFLPKFRFQTHQLSHVSRHVHILFVSFYNRVRFRKKGAYFNQIVTSARFICYESYSKQSS